ncbi:hypothetical protein GNP82_16610 [Aliivibrio fischeri]|uniref:flagellar biosynthetic protein FliR n=1 Tax=Aliivibrio fischeri TaxID=668 RepID=UPI0012D8CD9D|nr:flagellar biosynthetic protein FliR [Aliivibrio fischeri]MUK39175.1 hypothetical protein [Aliivibrio fischeri]MUL04125.1 hypothetical protein [Aliivibrio fischeri]MUL06649.1 hypothetical protein [Aliivibrio fischeri]
MAYDLILESIIFYILVFFAAIFFVPFFDNSKAFLYKISIAAVLGVSCFISFGTSGEVVSLNLETRIFIIGYSFFLGYLFVLPVHILLGIGDLLDTMRGEGYVDSISSLSDEGESTLAKLFFMYYLTHIMFKDAFFIHIGSIVNILIELKVDPIEYLFDEFLSIYHLYMKEALYFIIPLILVDVSIAFISKLNSNINMLTFSMPIKSILVLYLLVSKGI